MFKIITIALFFLFSTLSLNAEIVRNLKIIGNERVSDETIKVYGDIELGKDYKESDLNNILQNLYSTDFFEDVQVALLKPPEGEEQKIVIQVTRQPMLIWIWLGGLLMLVGAVLSIFPQTGRPVLRKGTSEKKEVALREGVEA